MATKTKMFKVIDTTSLCFYGYAKEPFATLAEAFARAAEMLEEEGVEEIEIEVPGSETNIQIDARYVDFDADEEDS